MFAALNKSSRRGFGFLFDILRINSTPCIAVIYFTCGETRYFDFVKVIFALCAECENSVYFFLN